MSSTKSELSANVRTDSGKSSKFELLANLRTDSGKSSCKKLRKDNQIPAIVYGGKEANSLISLNHNQVLQATEHEKFYSQILNLKIDGNLQKVLLKDLQRHPFKPKILHIDFQRVKETDLVNMQVPLHFIGADKSPGVKLGGLVNHYTNNVEVRCEARYLPEFIEVDISGLNLGEVLHLSNLNLPKSVEILALLQNKFDAPVVGVQLMKVATETESSITNATEQTDKELKEKDNKDKGKATTSTPKAAANNPKSDKK